MKTAKVDKGTSLTEGGRTIEAINADYDTYLKEKIVCPFCYSPVYLRAKESKKKEAHWVHFPGYGMGCVAKSKPSLLQIKLNESLEKEFRGQCVAMFKQHLKVIFYYAYSQEGYDSLVADMGHNWVNISIERGERFFNSTFPQFPLNSWLKKIPALLKNTTATCAFIETFFEEVLTNPDFSIEVQKVAKTRVNTWDDSFITKVVNGFPYHEMLRHRTILLELMKFFGNVENVDVFLKWLQLNLLSIAYYYKSGYEIGGRTYAKSLFQKYSPEKVMVLYSLFNITLIDWDTAFRLLRNGEAPKVYTISYGNLNVLQDYLHMCSILKPIKLASDRGFGKR